MLRSLPSPANTGYRVRCRGGFMPPFSDGGVNRPLRGSRLLARLAMAALLALIEPGAEASATAQKTPRGDTSAATPHPRSATLDLAQYLAELDRWSAAAARLEQHPEEAAQLEKDLPDSWSVTSDGEHFSVPTDWLRQTDRKSTRLNSSHGYISYAVFCLKKKKKNKTTH